MSVIDLFCGAGGLTYGLQQAGLNVLASIDYWDKSIESCKKNFNHLSICKNLVEYKPEELAQLVHAVDIIVGGPPCQSFSIAGKRKLDDPRNSLFMEFIKFVKFYRPKLIMIENVVGILSKKNLEGIKIIDIILDILEQDYNCKILKLYASDFQVPQKRRRIFIIGIRKDFNMIPSDLNIKFPEIPIRNVLIDRNNIDSKYFLSQRAIEGINRRKEKAKQNGNGFGAQFVNMDKPCYTITCRYYKDGSDALVKYDENNIRKLTITELKRIQTFPDNYYLSGSEKDQIIQIGNAVPCMLAYHLGTYLLKILKNMSN